MYVCLYLCIFCLGFLVGLRLRFTSAFVSCEFFCFIYLVYYLLFYLCFVRFCWCIFGISFRDSVLLSYYLYWFGVSSFSATAIVVTIPLSYNTFIIPFKRRRINLIFSLFYSSTIWDRARHRGPGKRELKTEEILSEYSTKTLWKWMKITAI